MYCPGKGAREQFLGNAAQPVRDTYNFLFRDYDFATTLREFIGVIEDRSLRVARVRYMRRLSARFSARRWFVMLQNLKRQGL
jgi:hypothetical protein